MWIECKFSRGRFVKMLKVFFQRDGFQYEGEISGTNPHGVGKISYPNGTWVYGCFEHGKCIGPGHGLVKLAEGFYFEGKLLNGTPHGKGTLIFPDDRKVPCHFHKGVYCKGPLKNKEPHGQVIMIFHGNQIVEGDFQEGVLIKQTKLIPIKDAYFLVEKIEASISLDRLLEELRLENPRSPIASSSSKDPCPFSLLSNRSPVVERSEPAQENPIEPFSPFELPNFFTDMDDLSLLNRSPMLEQTESVQENPIEPLFPFEPSELLVEKNQDNPSLFHGSPSLEHITPSTQENTMESPTFPEISDLFEGENHDDLIDFLNSPSFFDYNKFVYGNELGLSPPPH